MRIGAAREMEIRRLDFGRGEGIHGEWRKVDWTVYRCLSQWAQYGTFKRFDQPETPLAHRINDFWPASGARANVKARLLIRWRVISSRFIRESVRRTASKQRRRGKTMESCGKHLLPTHYSYQAFAPFQWGKSMDMIRRCTMRCRLEVRCFGQREKRKIVSFKFGNSIR